MSAKIIAFSTCTASWPISPVRATRRRWARWRPSDCDEARRKAGVGRGGQPVVVTDPVDDARGQHVALPAQRRPAPFALDPVVDQAHRERRRARDRRSRAGRAARRSRSRHRATACPCPRARHGGSALRGVHRADLAMGQQLADHQPQADRPNRPATDRARRQRSCAGRDGRGSRNRRASPAASGRTVAERGVAGAGRVGSGRVTGPGHQRVTGPSGICNQRHSSSWLGPALVAELLRGRPSLPQSDSLWRCPSDHRGTWGP